MKSEGRRLKISARSTRQNSKQSLKVDTYPSGIMNENILHLYKTLCKPVFVSVERLSESRTQEGKKLVLTPRKRKHVWKYGSWGRKKPSRNIIRFRKEISENKQEKNRRNTKEDTELVGNKEFSAKYNNLQEGNGSIAKDEDKEKEKEGDSIHKKSNEENSDSKRPSEKSSVEDSKRKRSEGSDMDEEGKARNKNMKRKDEKYCIDEENKTGNGDSKKNKGEQYYTHKESRMEDSDWKNEHMETHMRKKQRVQMEDSDQESENYMESMSLPRSSSRDTLILENTRETDEETDDEIVENTLRIATIVRSKMTDNVERRVSPSNSTNKVNSGGWKFRKKRRLTLEDDEDDDCITIQKQRLKNRRRIISSDEESDSEGDKDSEAESDETYILNRRELRIVLTRLEDIKNDPLVDTWMRSSEAKNIQANNLDSLQTLVHKDRRSSYKVMSKNQESDIKSTSHVSSKNENLIVPTIEDAQAIDCMSKSTDDLFCDISEQPSILQTLSTTTSKSLPSTKTEDKPHRKNPHILLVDLKTLGIQQKSIYSAAKIDNLTKKFYKSVKHCMIPIVYKDSKTCSESESDDSIGDKQQSSVEPMENWKLHSLSLEQPADSITNESHNESNNTSTKNKHIRSKEDLKKHDEHDLQSPGTSKQKQLVISIEKPEKPVSAANMLRIWRKAFCVKSPVKIVTPSDEMSKKDTPPSTGHAEECTVGLEKNAENANQQVSSKTLVTIVKKTTPTGSDLSTPSFAVKASTVGMPQTSEKNAHEEENRDNILIKEKEKRDESKTDSEITSSERDNDTSLTSNTLKLNTNLNLSRTLDSPQKCNLLKKINQHVEMQKRTDGNSTATKYHENSPRPKPTVRTYRCLGCHVTFTNYHDMQKHYESHCFRPTSQKTDEEKSKQSETETQPAAIRNEESAANNTRKSSSSSTITVESARKSTVEMEYTAEDRAEKSERSTSSLPSKEKGVRKESVGKSSKGKSGSKKMSKMERRYNENSKDLHCSVCTRLFETKAELSAHLYLHTESELQEAYKAALEKLQRTKETSVDLKDKRKTIAGKKGAADNKSATTTEDPQRKENEVVSTADAIGSNEIERTVDNMENKSDSAQTNRSADKEITEKSAESSEQTQPASTSQNRVELNSQSLVMTASTSTSTAASTSTSASVSASASASASAPASASASASTSMSTSTAGATSAPLSASISGSNRTKMLIAMCECHKTESISSTVRNFEIEIILFCRLCRTLFRRIDCFMDHYKRIEGSICSTDQSFGRVPKLFCSSCRIVLNSLPEMRCHLEMHTRKDTVGVVRFLCNICKVVFHNLGPLFHTHWFSHSKNPFYIATRLSFPRMSLLGSITDRSKYLTPERAKEGYIIVAENVCRHCKISFEHQHALKAHEPTCSKNVANEGRKENESESTSIVGNHDPTVLHTQTIYNRDAQNSTDVRITCSICKITFNLVSAYRDHARQHIYRQCVTPPYACVFLTPTKKTYVCKLCQSVYNTLAEFELHWPEHATMREEFVCTKCEKIFDTYESFSEHVSEHVGPLFCNVKYRAIKFICGACDIAFDSEEKLKAHSVRHSKSYLKSMTVRTDNEIEVEDVETQEVQVANKTKTDNTSRGNRGSNKETANEADDQTENLPDSENELIIDEDKNDAETEESDKRKDVTRSDSTTVVNEKRKDDQKEISTVIDQIKSVELGRTSSPTSDSANDNAKTNAEEITAPPAPRRGFIRVKTLAELTEKAIHKCPSCSLTFDSSEKLSDHSLIHRNEQITTLTPQNTVDDGTSGNPASVAITIVDTNMRIMSKASVLVRPATAVVSTIPPLVGIVNPVTIQTNQLRSIRPKPSTQESNVQATSCSASSFNNGQQTLQQTGQQVAYWTDQQRNYVSTNNTGYGITDNRNVYQYVIPLSTQSVSRIAQTSNNVVAHPNPILATQVKPAYQISGQSERGPPPSYPAQQTPQQHIPVAPIPVSTRTDSRISSAPIPNIPIQQPNNSVVSNAAIAAAATTSVAPPQNNALEQTGHQKLFQCPFCPDFSCNRIVDYYRHELTAKHAARKQKAQNSLEKGALTKEGGLTVDQKLKELKKKSSDQQQQQQQQHQQREQTLNQVAQQQQPQQQFDQEWIDVSSLHVKNVNDNVNQQRTDINQEKQIAVTDTSVNKIYVCDYCPDRVLFSTQELMQCHLDEKHNYVCNVCDKRMYTSKELQVHKIKYDIMRAANEFQKNK